MSKALDDIIIGRISRLINYVENPTELLEQIDNLRYFVEKKVSLTSKLSKQASLQVGSTS